MKNKTVLWKQSYGKHLLFGDDRDCGYTGIKLRVKRTQDGHERVCITETQASLYALSLLSPLAPPLVTLLGDRELDTLALGQRHLGLGTLTNDENVGKPKHFQSAIAHQTHLYHLPSSEGPVQHVLDVNNVETTQVPLLVNDHTRSTHVTTASDHDDVSGFELDVVNDLVLNEVELDSVVDLDSRVGVSDGSAIVGNDVGNALGTKLMLSDLEELESSLLGGNSVNGESALDVVEKTEVLARSLNGDDIYRPGLAARISTSPSSPTHETSGEGLVSPDLAVDLDESLLNNSSDLTASKSVLQTVSKEDGEGKRLPELVGTRRRTGGLKLLCG